KRLQRAVDGFLFFSCEVEFGLVFRDVDLSGGRVARDLLRKSRGRGGDGGAVGASCQCHECQRAEKGDNDQGRSTKRSGRSSFHSTPLWSATAVRASAGTRSPYIIRPEGVLEQAKSNLWITYAEVRRLLLRCFGGFGGGLLLFLELAYLLQGEVIDDIGDGATAVLGTVVPGGFPPSLGLESELLAQQREEDLRLLIAESRK